MVPRGVYAVDGRNWEQDLMAPSALEKARSLFGSQGDQFLKKLEPYRYLWSRDIDGKVGLWSKADSYVFFENLLVKDR